MPDLKQMLTQVKQMQEQLQSQTRNMFGGFPFPGFTPPATGAEPAPGDKKPEDKKEEQPKLVPGGSDKATTNLLPGQAVAVYRFYPEQLRGSPAYGMLMDSSVAQMFQSTFGFTPEDVDTYVHCFAGADREPFGVVKLKVPTKAPELLARMPVSAVRTSMR